VIDDGFARGHCKVVESGLVIDGGFHLVHYARVSGR